MIAPLYRDYDQDGLDRQFNLRARWPEHPTYFARWENDSAAVRERLPARLDLAYGTSPGERLDLFPAAGSGQAPLLAFIHGGYWQALDKSDFSYLAPAFVEAGIAFASLNYDLAPQTRIAEMVAQVRRALAWLYCNAAGHGIDPARIYVAGHSAGGHLTAMALATDWAYQNGLPADLVKGGCSVSGVYDLEPISLSYHQAVLSVTPQEVAACSPIRCLPGQAGPLLCAVGSEETDEFLRQQADYLAAWRAAGLPGTAIDLPKRNHFTAVDALGEPGHPLFQAVCRLVATGHAAA
ncbi:MAG: alpha/beta hydrolase [Kiloniellales bacterium]